ncbi:MAG: TadE family protein [Dehalococcoidia bacterium]
MMKKRNHGRKRERGQALAEFAMITPLLVILIFGFVDVARLYHSWVTIQGAAREAARYGVTGREDCPIASDDRVSCIEYHAEERAQPLANIDTGLTVSVRSWDYPDYVDPAIEGDPGQQCDALEVQVEYDYSPSTPLADVLLGGVHLTARERLVNEPFGVCGS